MHISSGAAVVKKIGNKRNRWFIYTFRRRSRPFPPRGLGNNNNKNITCYYYYYCVRITLHPPGQFFFFFPLLTWSNGTRQKSFLGGINNAKYDFRNLQSVRDFLTCFFFFIRDKRRQVHADLATGHAIPCDSILSTAHEDPQARI